jgi:PAS domain S-box-containing protein
MFEKLAIIYNGSSTSVKRPIAREVSLRLTVLTSIIIILLSIASYFYSVATIEELVREQIIVYSHGREHSESALFLESNAYQLRFQKEYVERYKRMGDNDPIEWFNKHMEKNEKDGTYRSKPELYYGIDRELGRRDHSASMMVGAKTKITPEVRRALAVGYDMINQYGPAWREPFVDLYFSSPEKTSVSRWPGTPWGLMMDDEVEWRDEEWMAITMKENNPGREQKWSGVLYDERNGNWMVSGVTPLDIDGKQVGMVGTDLLLNDLIERTNSNVLFGTYNILIQKEGRIIAHPHMVKEIIASKGLLTAQKVVSKNIQRIYKLAKAENTFPAIIDNDKDNEFLSIARIEGPGWYLITVYPKSLIHEKALRNVWFTLLSGLGTLVVIIIVILIVLKHNLVLPLTQLTQNVNDFKFDRTELFDRVDTISKRVGELDTRSDEIGLLSHSFANMRDNLRNTYFELQESEFLFSQMFEQTTTSMCLYNPDGTIYKVNNAFCKLFGVEKQVIIDAGYNVFEDQAVIDTKIVPLLREIFDEKKTQTWKINFDIDVASESTRTPTYRKGKIFLEVFGYPILNSKGGLEYVVLQHFDITKRKQMEKEKIQLEEQYRQTQKMESVGRLAGGVAHDYNNVLSVIMGYTELAITDVDPTGPLYSNLNEVLNAAKRARDITRQLLAFARKETIAPKVLDLNKNIGNMLKMLRHLIGEDIDLTWLPGDGLWRVKMDPSQVDQIMANLCVNARDAIAGVGKITLETNTAVLDETYCANHTGFIPGDFVLLVLSDTGCGMEKEILKDIFEPFFTTKDVDKGTGLGLATVYGIVKQNNGFINVYSEPGEGTTIKIYLPRHEGKAAEVEEKKTAEIPQGRGETILLVEDDRPILKLTQKLLNNLGYNVLTADTPKRAIKLAKEYKNKIHLLVTDVIMPEMNGLELANSIESLYPDLRRIFMSGYTANAIAHHGVLDEGVQFVQKPFSKKDLATIVRKVLDE